MSKMQVTLDASKIRPLVSERSYENKNGDTVIVQEVKFELVEIKPENQKVIHQKDKLKIVKTHFAAKIQTAEERQTNEPTVYIGEGFSFVWENDVPVQTTPAASPAQTSGTKDDFPF